MKITAIVLLALCFFAFVVPASAFQPIVIRTATQEVEYKSGDIKMKGFLAYPDVRNRKSPAVIVVHEWWGLNDYARDRAKQLAKLGYVAFAIDLYGDGKTAQHPDDAKKFAEETLKNFQTAKERFQAAVDFLKQQPQVEPDKIAAIGYCFGGGVVLNMARQGADLRAVASFHGSLVPVKPAEKGTLKAKIAVFNGADDKMVTADQIDAFKKEMDQAGADYLFFNYPGAKHSFTNPAADRYAKQFNLDLGYNKLADMRSWNELKSFLRSAFSTSAERQTHAPWSRQK
jgi:dienelactone hydrolase